ncbi:hypothetical protein EW146_g10227 [Bondarzewia mesenterica]|uniref:Cytochrome P450 n=1 Tax=Bondarzewia mesenterica TaxID=1095465 RepID=A0A4S4L3Z9_9AGAM|nr:hypothetical protein EW146_g10227 [Bondarzewia mesenterica]
MLELDLMNTGFVNIAAVAALSLAVFGILAHKARRPPLPPGPKSSWFGLGQPIMPELYPWRTYAAWKDVYGDIIYIRAFGNSVIVLNSAKAADDLLDKRGAIYSSRPMRTMIEDVWVDAGTAYSDCAHTMNVYTGWDGIGPSWECPMAIHGGNTEEFFRNTSTRALLAAMNRFRSGRLTRSSETCFTAPRTITITYAGAA